MIVARTDRQCQDQACLSLERESQAGRSIGRWREILRTHRTKFTVPVVKPDLKTFVRKDLFNDQIRNPVTIEVRGCKRERGFARFEGQLTVSASREMELDAKQAPAFEDPRVEQYRSVRSCVTVEVGCRQPLPERGAEEDRRFFRIRPGPIQPVLRP